MKAGLMTVFLLVLAGNLTGCGQKGPLYRESPAAAEAVNSTNAAGGSEQKERAAKKPSADAPR